MATLCLLVKGGSWEKQIKDGPPSSTFLIQNQNIFHTSFPVKILCEITRNNCKRTKTDPRLPRARRYITSRKIVSPSIPGCCCQLLLFGEGRSSLFLSVFRNKRDPHEPGTMVLLQICQVSWRPLVPRAKEHNQKEWENNALQFLFDY
jgi:hypothetical protein